MSIMLMYVPLVLIAAAYFVYWYITRTFNYWKDRNIVTPPVVPLFGSFKESAQRKIYLGCLLQRIYQQFPDEKVVGIYRMTTPSILIRDLDIIKHLMIKDFDLFADRGIQFSTKGLGTNLFHANTETWRLLRARFSPMFSTGKLKNMFHLVSEKAVKIVFHLTKYNSMPSEHDIQEISKTYTISTIIACAFGLDIDLNDPNLKILHNLEKLISTPNYAFEFDMMFPGVLKRLNVDLFPSKLSIFFDNLVKIVFAQRNGKPTNRKDFMDLILKMRQEKVLHGGKQINDSKTSLELSDSIIAAQAFIFYAGGYETSSAAITFLLYELTQYPNVQDKLIAEIDEVLENTDGEITYDSLMEMPYLANVLDETLRKYPIVEPIQRCAHADYKIPEMDLVIKKGQIVYLSALGVHYDEKYYRNPEVFDPERFSPENSRDRHSCAYIPFGIGPRNCIGMRFGKIQTLTFVVKLLSHYRVEPSENTPKMIAFEPNRLLLGPLNGLRLNIIRRCK